MNGVPLSRTRVVTLLLVGLLVVSAGCSGFGGGGGDAGPTGEDDPQPSATPNATADENETVDDNETVDGNGSTDDSADAAATGRMAVVVDGERIDLDRAYDGSAAAFRVEDGSTDVWHRTNGTVTVADALATLGVEASNDTITYANKTYVDGENGTSVTVRVNGEPVDPTAYELQNGDELWVVVETPETDPPVPGEHIGHDQLHVHGGITFDVDGETVDFSDERYQNPDHSEHFHFEGGAAEPWHAHSWSVTLGYAMSTLDGIQVTEDSVTYGNETYVDGENATVTVEVNGESVDPDEYVLKDGDSVRIVVNSTT